jgi:hypothetical protein
MLEAIWSLARLCSSAELAAVMTATLEKPTTVVVKHLSAQPSIESQPSVLFGIGALGRARW